MENKLIYEITNMLNDADLLTLYSIRNVLNALLSEDDDGGTEKGNHRKNRKRR